MLNPQINFSYFTSQTGPPILASSDDLHESTSHTLGPVLQLASSYDGFLIACYADHPLTALLQLELAPTPVIGIFDASVLAATSLLGPGAKFGIITTGPYYEAQLAEGVRRILKAKGMNMEAMFAGVASTGISPARLRDETRGGIRRRVEAATRRLLAAGDVDVICIGGVILAGIDDWIRATCVAELGIDRGGSVVVVDQMVAGVQSLVKCVRTAFAIPSNA